VRDTTTKKCTVVDSKPTTTTTTVVGDGVYKTKVEAERAIKTTRSAPSVRRYEMPVILMWAVPAVIVIGGASYWILHMH
jgi:hypothetical protein